MHIGPQEARTYLSTFLGQYSERPDRQVWFFPPAVSLEAVATIVAKRLDLLAGAQDIYWEPKGRIQARSPVPWPRWRARVPR